MWEASKGYGPLGKHPQLDRHSFRGSVARSNGCDHATHFKGLESILETTRRSFCGVSPIPIGLPYDVTQCRFTAVVNFNLEQTRLAQRFAIGFVDG